MADTSKSAPQVALSDHPAQGADAATEAPELMAGKAQRSTRGVPVVGVVLLCVAAAIAGAAGAIRTTRSSAKVAVVEKGGVVLQVLLEHPGLTPEQTERWVRAPVLRVLKKYADAGYVVVDVARDRSGQLMVDAVPPDAIDITQELRKAVGLVDAARAESPAEARTLPVVRSGELRSRSDQGAADEATTQRFKSKVIPYEDR